MVSGLSVSLALGVVCVQFVLLIGDWILLIGDWILLIGDWIFRGIGFGRGLRGGWLTETESDPWCPLTLTTV